MTDNGGQVKGPPELTDQGVLDFYPTIAGPVWRIIRLVLAHSELFDAQAGDETLERAATFLEALVKHDRSGGDGNT